MIQITKLKKETKNKQNCFNFREINLSVLQKKNDFEKWNLKIFNLILEFKNFLILEFKIFLILEFKNFL